MRIEKLHNNNMNNRKIILTIFFLLFALTDQTIKAQISDSIKVDLSKYRWSLDEMQKIANTKLLPHRIFYQKPSVGPDAIWFDAVKQGNLDLIKLMVNKGQDIEVKDEASLGQTALGWASFIGYLDVVQYLVDQGANVRATDRADVYNSVKSAVLGGNVEVLKYLHYLLKDEVDWDAKEDDGETLLAVAAVDGRYDALLYILSFNPKSINNIAEKYDTSPLSGACDRGYTDVVNLLIGLGAINHKTGKSSCN